jgi:hypothetical protein
MQLTTFFVRAAAENEPSPESEKASGCVPQNAELEQVKALPSKKERVYARLLPRL